MVAIAPRRHESRWPCLDKAERYRCVFVSGCGVFLLSVTIMA